jgi:hypothetical protein
MPGAGDEEKKPEAESYTASYLAYQRSIQTAAPPPRKARRWQGPGRGLLLLIVAAGALYFYRAEVVGFLREHLGRGMMETVGGAMGWKNEQTGAIRPTGGVTTFADGGTASVEPDDGSDRYRVVVPPGGTP